ncbi:MAG: hypothetical protein JWQ27_1995 [Ferruginibacter sp.]|nr:hypothetical protein [Ferruginibacter sp.]
MDPQKTPAPVKRSLIKRWRRRLFKFLKLSDSPSVKLYNGFGNDKNCLIYGHALSVSPLGRKKYRNNFLYNTLAVLRLFIVNPIKAATLQLEWEGKVYETVSEADGFFKFEWQPEVALTPGCYSVKVNLILKKSGNISCSAKASLTVPTPSEFAFISDIDDTFLISHSSNLRKRLFVLLTENARSRKPFEGVVNHYRLLSNADEKGKTANAFFYVSSSEWNLYEYIREFSRQNKLPEGVYLLNQIKMISQIFKTGQNNHSGKFTRIVRILESFPNQQFILLGDDSQQDANIYASIVAHFHNKIFCVYIRSVNKKAKPPVVEKLKEIENAGVLTCYFNHSADAIQHSKEVGIIDEPVPLLPPLQVGERGLHEDPFTQQ